MAKKDESLTSAKTSYEKSVDRNLSLASRVLGNIADLIEKAGKDGALSDDDADIELSKVHILKSISERALEISRLYNKIYDANATEIEFENLVKLSKLIEQQLEDINKYKRDDEVKRCLESLERSYFELANDHYLFCDALKKDANLDLKVPEKRDTPHRKIKRESSFYDKAVIFSDNIQHSFKDLQDDIVKTASFSSRTKAIFNKIASKKKYKFYLGAAALGIVALGLTVACPPAAGCAAVITVSYVFGIADGAAGAVLASRDIYHSVEEDIGIYNVEHKLKEEIKNLRDSRERKLIDPDKQIDPDKETRKILKYFNEQAIRQATDIIREKSDAAENICENESIGPELREDAKAGVVLCQSMLDASDEIKRLNTQLISLFKAELQTDEDTPQHKDREEIATRFDNIITKLDKLRVDSEKLNIPKSQKAEIVKAIDENTSQIKDMKSDFTQYLNSARDSKIEKAKLIQDKIKSSKRSRLIAGAGIALACVSLGLAMACPFVGPPLVGVAIAIFAAQLIVGAVATAIATYDLQHAQRSISENKDDLKVQKEAANELSALQERMASLTISTDPSEGRLLDHAPIKVIGAGASERIRTEHSDSADTIPEVTSPEVTNPSTKSRSTRDRP